MSTPKSHILQKNFLNPGPTRKHRALAGKTPESARLTKKGSQRTRLRTQSGRNPHTCERWQVVAVAVSQTQSPSQLQNHLRWLMWARSPSKVISMVCPAEPQEPRPANRMELRMTSKPQLLIRAVATKFFIMGSPFCGGLLSLSRWSYYSRKGLRCQPFSESFF